VGFDEVPRIVPRLFDTKTFKNLPLNQEILVFPSKEISWKAYRAIAKKLGMPDDELGEYKSQLEKSRYRILKGPKDRKYIFLNVGAISLDSAEFLLTFVSKLSSEMDSISKKETKSLELIICDTLLSYKKRPQPQLWQILLVQ